jgi:hypothetical protein
MLILVINGLDALVPAAGFKIIVGVLGLGVMIILWNRGLSDHTRA